MNKQRTSYGNGTLAADRIRRLEELPGWTWNILTGLWQEGFSHLLGFAEREGHTRVPDNHVEDRFRLGQWVTAQRTIYGKGKLEDDRIRRLEELPGWTWDILTDQWEQGFGYLLRFAERQGHSRVPDNHVEDGFRLGKWVGKQRTSYGRGNLAPDRFRRLEELPRWTWDILTDQWEQGFGYLLRFAEREGHTRVPRSHEGDGYRLGPWVDKQRTSYGRGTLAPDRIRRLEELPGWSWDPRADRWEEGFGYLLHNAERQGHTRVSASYKADGYRLGQWVTVQRTSYGNGKLDADRIRRLEELPGWTWNILTGQWEEGFGYLLHFAEREGHPLVPAKHVEDGYRLGQWVTNQRASYGRGKLAPDRICRLEELPGWTWDARADRWEEGFGYLLRFAERRGHTSVPASHEVDSYRLGGWVGKQRTSYGNGKLAPDRIRRLEELPGWAWRADSSG